MQDYIGKQVDRYRVTARLGMGGMATVYKAYDTRLDRDIALKLIRTRDIPESQHKVMMQRFEREAKAQARFSHPNIVPVHDYGEVDSFPYLVMKFLPGGSLEDRITGQIEYQQALSWLIPIADALSYAHDRGVVHRDVKPSNILFDEIDRPILTDFGIAKVLMADQATLTGTGLSMGTPEYMAPEQWQGQSSAASDQYALGVILYELITGKRPFSADTPAAVVILQATQPLQPPRDFNPGIPQSVEKILDKALARDPQDRYESMTVFKQAFAGLALVSDSPDSEKTIVYDQRTILPSVPEADVPTQLFTEHEMPVDREDVHQQEQNHTPVPLQAAGEDVPQKRFPGWVKWAGITTLLVGLVCVGSVMILSVTGVLGRISDIVPSSVSVADSPTQEIFPEILVALTPTLTDIPESTATPTAEPSHTPTAEPTYTSTYEPSLTYTPTEVITPTPMAYVTPTPQAYYPLPNCAPSHLYLNDSAFISYSGTKNSLRSEPDTSSPDNIIAEAHPGEVLRIVGGPVCNFGWVLWEVKTTRQETGWTPETDGIDFWLLPLTTRQLCDGALPSRLVVGSQAKVNEEPQVANRVREEPAGTATIVGRIQPGEWVMVLDGPHCGERINWWKVETMTGDIIGWTAEGDAGNYFLSPEP